MPGLWYRIRKGSAGNKRPFLLLWLIVSEPDINLPIYSAEFSIIFASLFYFGTAIFVHSNVTTARNIKCVLKYFIKIIFAFFKIFKFTDAFHLKYVFQYYSTTQDDFSRNGFRLPWNPVIKQSSGAFSWTYRVFSWSLFHKTIMWRSNVG